MRNGSSSTVRSLHADAGQAKETEMRNAVLIEKQRREQYQRMAPLVHFLGGGMLNNDLARACVRCLCSSSAKCMTSSQF